jgi:hypothetical protein
LLRGNTALSVTDGNPLALLGSGGPSSNCPSANFQNALERPNSSVPFAYIAAATYFFELIDPALASGTYRGGKNAVPIRNSILQLLPMGSAALIAIERPDRTSFSIKP